MQHASVCVHMTCVLSHSLYLSMHGITHMCATHGTTRVKQGTICSSSRYTNAIGLRIYRCRIVALAPGAAGPPATDVSTSHAYPRSRNQPARARANSRARAHASEASRRAPARRSRFGGGLRGSRSLPSPGVRQNVSSPFKNLELLAEEPMAKARCVSVPMFYLQLCCMSVRA